MICIGFSNLAHPFFTLKMNSHIVRVVLDAKGALTLKIGTTISAQAPVAVRFETNALSLAPVITSITVILFYPSILKNIAESAFQKKFPFDDFLLNFCFAGIYNSTFYNEEFCRLKIGVSFFFQIIEDDLSFGYFSYSL